MREFFSSFSEEQKNIAYEQLCSNIKNGEIDQLYKSAALKLDLSYKLPLNHDTDQILLEQYYDSALGLALFSQHADAKKILQVLFEITEINNLPIHGPIYFLLAAKKGDDLAIILVQNLFDIYFKKGIILDLNFIANKKILDLNVIEQRDFLEIAIENCNENFIKWILQKKFIKTKIFEPKVKHLQHAIIFFSKNILEHLLFNVDFSTKDLKKCLAEQFPCITVNISYLDYLKEFNFEFYQKVTEHALRKTMQAFDLEVFFWLLNNGIQITTEHSWFFKSILPMMQQEYSFSNLLKIGIDFKNLQLIKELLIAKKTSVEAIIKYSKDNRLTITADLQEIITEDFYNILLCSKDLDLLIDYIYLLDISLHCKFWRMLITLPDERFNKIIECFYENGLKTVVLNGFLDFVAQGRIRVVIKFLKTSSQNQLFLLHGNEEITALSIACENCDVEMIKFLLPYLNANQINKTLSKLNCYENITALWLSIALQHKEGIKLLLNHSAIEIDTGKGWHKKIRAGANLTCKELDPSFKFPDIEYNLVLMPLYNSGFNQANYIENSELNTKNKYLEIINQEQIFSSNAQLTV